MKKLFLGIICLFIINNCFAFNYKEQPSFINIGCSYKPHTKNHPTILNLDFAILGWYFSYSNSLNNKLIDNYENWNLSDNTRNSEISVGYLFTVIKKEYKYLYLGPTLNLDIEERLYNNRYFINLEKINYTGRIGFGIGTNFYKNLNIFTSFNSNRIGISIGYMF